MIFCRNCGRAMNENQAICLGCGVKKGTGISFCEYCGSGVSSAAAVCLRCGAAIKNNGSGRSSGGGLAGYSKSTILILCIFLGSFGIHNFVMGDVKRGIVKIIVQVVNMAMALAVSVFALSILASIAVFVLWLIDVIRICTNSYEADPDKFF